MSVSTRLPDQRSCAQIAAPEVITFPRRPRGIARLHFWARPPWLQDRRIAELRRQLPDAAVAMICECSVERVRGAMP
jgi:hypothetical protein